MLERLTSMILRGRPAPPEASCQGSLAPQREPVPYSARASFFDLAEAMARRERLPLHLAMARLKVERPAEYRAAFPARRHGRRLAVPTQAAASSRLILEQAG